MENELIINVGRQLGSGGRVIAKKLAERFNCNFYDKEILNLAAKESGFSEKFFEQNDEQKGFFKSLFDFRLPMMVEHGFYRNKFSQESLYQMQSEAMLDAAEHHPRCVFVGRTSDYIFRNKKNVLNIFLTAPWEDRVRNICKRTGCTEEKAQKILENGDEIRSKYYDYYTGKEWGHATSYDLCINVGLLGIDGTTDFIAEIIERKFLQK